MSEPPRAPQRPEGRGAPRSAPGRERGAPPDDFDGPSPDEDFASGGRFDDDDDDGFSGGPPEPRRPSPRAPEAAPRRPAPTGFRSATPSRPAPSHAAPSRPAEPTPPPPSASASDPAPMAPPAAGSPGPAKATPAEPRLRRAALQEWEALVDMLREGKPALAAVLEHGVPRVVSNEKIVISFQEGSFYGRQANARAAREAILEAAASRLGARPELEVRFDAGSVAEQERTVAAVEVARRKGRQEQRRREVLSHPAVKDAMEVFPASSGRVQVRLGEE